MHQKFPKEGEDEIDVATRLADKVCGEFGSKQPLLNRIKNICYTRFSLSVTAKHLHTLYASTFTTVSKQLQHLFHSASRLCDECRSDWPR